MGPRARRGHSPGVWGGCCEPDPCRGCWPKARQDWQGRTVAGSPSGLLLSVCQLLCVGLPLLLLLLCVGPREWLLCARQCKIPELGGQGPQRPPSPPCPVPPGVSIPGACPSSRWGESARSLGSRFPCCAAQALLLAEVLPRPRAACLALQPPFLAEPAGLERARRGQQEARVCGLSWSGGGGQHYCVAAGVGGGESLPQPAVLH